MKSKIFYLSCLLLGETLLFSAFKAWIVLGLILPTTIGVSFYRYKLSDQLPEILLKKAKVFLALIFWISSLCALHSFTQTLSCLNCMKGIQRANALHFWDPLNPSIRLWIKNIYRVYPRPVWLLLLLTVLTCVYVLFTKMKGKKK